MRHYFGPQGLLAQKIEHFEFRAAQLEMAESVHECFLEKVPVLVEAGTGTGKTWAYLIPAILSGKRVVISTGTKTLQDQVLDHDIPFLRRLVFPQLRAVCLKGRKNYLCRRRYREFSYQPTLYSREEAKLFRKFQQWATRTKTGDRAEITWLPDHFQTWNEVSSSSDQCLGQSCPDFPRCHLTLLRQQAADAHLMVVNHHLFFADLSLRKKGAGEVIPDYEAVVFDEAHQLEDVMGLYFGVGLSSTRLFELMREVVRECRADAQKTSRFQEILTTAQQLEPLGRRLHQHLSQSSGGHGRLRLDLQKGGPALSEACGEIIHALEQLGALFAPYVEDRPPFESFSRRSLEMAHDLREILEQRDETLVYWYEVTPQGVFIHGTPVEVSPILKERLFVKTSAVALTSATLSVAGSFDFLRASLGIPPEAREKLLPSPFVYEKQALLYVPSKFPAPQEPSFCARVAEEAFEILDKTRGRALFLFTSYRNMNDVHQRLKGRLCFPLLVQGQKPKRALLSEFKEKVDSVLFATSSFWQGIDVPGDALSCLLIDKLPFEAPDDPLTAARLEHQTRQGKSPFFSYQVPRAAIQLKQGVGRLIRSSQDRGIIAIFDVRLQAKSYGRLFMKSLPPCRVIHRLDEMDGFFSFPDAPSTQCQGDGLSL